MNFGQLNLHISNRASSEARQIRTERKTDFFMIQEPYSIGGTVNGFGLPKTNTVMGNQGLENRPMAAIVCKAEKEPLHLLQHCNKHFTVCKIRTTIIGFLKLVSGYTDTKHDRRSCPC